jgi:hypothetical protein
MNGYIDDNVHIVTVHLATAASAGLISNVATIECYCDWYASSDAGNGRLEVTYKLDTKIRTFSIGATNVSTDGHAGTIKVYNDGTFTVTT